MNDRQQTTVAGRRTADGRRQTTGNHLLPTTYYLLPTTFFLLALLTSCSGIGNGTLFNSPTDITLPEFRIGTQGVIATIAEGAPPAEVFENSESTMLIIMQNAGAEDANNGLFTISSNPGIFYFIRPEHTSDTFSLTGKTNTNPIGEELRFTIRAEARSLFPSIAQTREDIALHWCYQYKTQASAGVCVDTQKLSQRVAQKVCQEGTTTLSGGQGGPLSVESIALNTDVSTDDATFVTPRLTITFANVGGGDITLPQDAYSYCRGARVSTKDQARVRVFLSEEALDCASDTITFKNNKATLRCTHPEGIEKLKGTFIGSFRADIEYGYHQTISRTVVVKKDE